uniref:Uncharacterized protein n=1 Tax=Candidatus Kentrum sp. LFY TaxID=2126342 RepID=A0A450WI21_9GAMM|nr:MAG: hypothetical protein BECKLFY1418C_GA0070996_102520 [Candidatus Kentron sp. LFY]
MPGDPQKPKVPDLLVSLREKAQARNDKLDQLINLMTTNNQLLNDILAKPGSGGGGTLDLTPLIDKMEEVKVAVAAGTDTLGAKTDAVGATVSGIDGKVSTIETSIGKIEIDIDKLAQAW